MYRTQTKAVTGHIPTDSQKRLQRKGALRLRNSRCAQLASLCLMYETYHKAQAVADAYYILSDTTRRREYDTLYSSRKYREKTDDPTASTNFFAKFADMFTGGAAGAGAGAGTGAPRQPDAEHVFENVFEEVRHSLQVPIVYILLIISAPAFTAGGPACGSVVVIRGCRLRCRHWLHRSQHSRVHGRRVRWQSTRCYQGR